MRRFAFWFAIEFLGYALVVANGRAYTHAMYGATFATDILISLNAFIIGRKFVRDAEALDYWAMAGYVLGGGTGSLVAIWATLHIYGE